MPLPNLVHLQHEIRHLELETLLDGSGKVQENVPIRVDLCGSHATPHPTQGEHHYHGASDSNHIAHSPNNPGTSKTTADVCARVRMPSLFGVDSVDWEEVPAAGLSTRTTPP